MQRAREAGVEPDQRVLGRRQRELLAQALVVRVGVAEAVEHLRQAGDGPPHPAQLARRHEMRHQDERNRAAGEHHVVLGEPALDLLLDAGTAIAELRELDQMLELQIVDVVDHPRPEVTP